MASFTQAVALNNQAPTEGVDISGSVAKGLQTGMQLATAQEQVQSQKLKLEEDKIKLDQAKFQSFDNMMKTLNRAANPAIAKQLAKGMKNRFQQLGFDPSIIDITVSDPNFGRVYQNISDSISGKILNDKEALAEAVQSFQDAGMFTEGMNVIQNSMTRQQGDKQLAQQDRQFYANMQNQKDIAAMGIAKEQRTVGRAEAAVQRKEVQDLSKRLEADSVPEIVTTLKQVDKDIGGLYNPKAVAKLDQIAGEKGFLASIKIPWTEIKPFESAAIPEDSKPLYQAIASLRNTYLKMRSGGAVTDPEADRFLQELGAGGIRNGLQLQNGLQVLNNAIVSKIQTIEAGYSPEAVEMLASRGNPTSSKSLLQKMAKPSVDALPADLEAKKQKAIAAGYTPEEVEAYIKKLQGQ